MHAMSTHNTYSNVLKEIIKKVCFKRKGLRRIGATVSTMPELHGRSALIDF